MSLMKRLNVVGNRLCNLSNAMLHKQEELKALEKGLNSVGPNNLHGDAREWSRAIADVREAVKACYF